MRLATRLLLLALMTLGAPAAHAVVIPIGTLHANNASGLSLLAGQTVTVQGTVTCPNGIFSTFSVDSHIQDATGAIDIFHSGGIVTYPFVLGDSVEVTGVVTHFNGLTEISPISMLVQLGEADVLPAPLAMTCLEMSNQYFAGDLEPNENRLVRLDGLTIISGTWPSTVLAANTLLTVQDASGTATIFIDRDSPVNGSPTPADGFSIIGVLRQFDSSPPHTTGYQLVPRYASDVIGPSVPPCPGPGFTSSPITSVVSDVSATIVWTTDSPSTSTVNYGLTPTYTDVASDASMVTNHSVTLTGLQPRTLYYFQATSTDVDGTCPSIDRSFVTFPSPGTPGEIEVYFNQSVNHAFSSGQNAQGNVVMKTPFLALINAAEVSLDVALYYFDIPEITDALIAAKDRGVEVRLIVGHNNPQAEANRFQAAGGAVIASNYGGNHSAGIMHDKYLIKDFKSPDKDDAYLWTGSWNAFPDAQLEANNALSFHDYGLAAAYTVDFNQMWGSSTMTPNAANSKMGDRKRDITPHLFQVGDRPVECYMSPSDDPETRMIEYIEAAEHSQLFCIFSFTSDPLSDAMRIHRDATPGFVVAGLFDPGQVNVSSEWCKLDGDPGCLPFWAPRADVYQDNSNNYTLLHHKYQILDHGYPGATVWTGSHNWSNAAKTSNDENTVIIHDPTIANLYYQEWVARYLENGGGPTATLLAQFDVEIVSEGVEVRWQFGDPSRVSSVTLERSPSRTGPWTVLPLESPDPGALAVMVDRSAESGRSYYYRLTAELTDGTHATFGPVLAESRATIAVSGITATVPNPAPGRVRIDYTVARDENVKISLIDVTGRVADVLVDKHVSAGRYSAVWDATRGKARFSPGVYFVRWESAGRRMQRPLVLLP